MTNLRDKIIRAMLAAFSAAVLTLSLAAQTPTSPPRPPEPPRPTPMPAPVPRADETRTTTEKAIAVDPNVSAKFCISEGALRINGWEREEVRVFVRDGRPFEFRVLERNTRTERPNWLWITRSTSDTASSPFSNCLGGASVEIDVPVGTMLNLEARTSGAVIDTVKSASVKVIEGSIQLRNIPGGVKAETFQGDIILENSGGEITLKTVAGNIVAMEITPGSIGDVLSANTSSGSISFKDVKHRQIKAWTITGSMLFNGSLLAGGIYNFRTTNGTLDLQLPKDVSCTFVAAYGFGSFNYSLPINVLEERKTPGGNNVVARIGDGAATVNLTTISGNIAIRGQ